MLGEQEKYAEFIHFTVHCLSKGQTDKEKVGVSNTGMCKSDVKDFCNSS